MKTKVLIADDDPITRLDIRMALEEKGYEVIGEAGDGIDAVAVCKAEKPDVVLMDVQMPLFNGLKAAAMIYENNLCDCIVVLTAYSMEKYVKEAAAQGIMGYLVKPVSHEMLLPAIEVALSRAKEIKSLKGEITSAKKEVSDRKIMERGKGILMQKEGLTEEEAYFKLRKMAMNKRCSMADLAKMIVMNEEI